VCDCVSVCPCCNGWLVDWQGWRWAWIISGIPGIVLAGIMLMTVREPVRNTEDSAGIELAESDVAQPDDNWRRKVALICGTFFQPSLLMLCFAGSVRNAGLSTESQCSLILLPMYLHRVKNFCCCLLLYFITVIIIMIMMMIIIIYFSDYLFYLFIFIFKPVFIYGVYINSNSINSHQRHRHHHKSLY